MSLTIGPATSRDNLLGSILTRARPLNALHADSALPPYLDMAGSDGRAASTGPSETCWSTPCPHWPSKSRSRSRRTGLPYRRDRPHAPPAGRARYEAELAQRRYLRVDPDNRLVAATVEAEWNNKLRALDVAREDHERQEKADTLLDDDNRQRILALATDFPRLWRLLIEDVTHQE